MNRTFLALLLVVALVVIRALYVWMEAAYNVALLDLVSTELLTGRQAESVQALGHRLAAIGFALLATPLLISCSIKDVEGLVKRWAFGFAFGVMGFVSIYVASYHTQKLVMDAVVESTSQEVRYEAYYASVFRQLYIDGSIVDADYTPDTKTSAQTMWLPFALSEQINLPQSLKDDAGDIVFERAQKQLALERFERDYSAYIQYQTLVRDFLFNYRAASDESASKASPDEVSVANLYGSVVESIHKAEAGYARVSKAYVEHLGFLANNDFFVSDVRSLFGANKNEQLWIHSVLLKKMQIEKRYLSVDDWCIEARCPASAEHIRRVAQSALASKYKAAARGVPMGLTTPEFLASHEAFNYAMKTLQIPVKFDVSPVTFSRFKSMIDPSILRPDVGPLLAANYPELRGIALPAGLSDRELIHSDEFKSFVIKKLGSKVASLSPSLSKDEFFEEWLSTVSGELEQNQSALLPDSPMQMGNSESLETGYSAVRLLYIPPIAAALSAIMVVLNMAAILSNLFACGALRWVLRASSLTALLFAGYVVGGAAGMPTEATEAVWSTYQAQSPFVSVLWQVFFGIEYLIGAVAEISGLFIKPESLNRIIEYGLGWAL